MTTTVPANEIDVRRNTFARTLQAVEDYMKLSHRFYAAQPASVV